MRKIIIAGTGSGMPEYILPCAEKAIRGADYVIASERIAKSLNIENAYSFSGIDETLSLCRALLEKGDTAVAVSGDPLMYSFLKTAQRELGADNISVIPSLGAVQLMGARFGITTEDARILSLHGRQVSKSAIVRAVRENEKVFFFCDAKHTPAYIAGVLDENRLGEVTVCVGANLTYDNEIAQKGSASEIAQREYPGLSMAAVINKNAEKQSSVGLLRDTDFERTDAPMTKEEVRAAVILKMQTSSEDIVWDVGAGTGSISVECARRAAYGAVYAIERNADAVRALELNKNKFGLENMHIIEKNALDALGALPEPDKVFIGGTGGELDGIFEFIMNIKKRVRVVMTAVTLETQAAAFSLMKRLDGFDAVSLSVSRAGSVGAYTVMEPNNAVMILSGYTKGLE